MKESLLYHSKAERETGWGNMWEVGGNVAGNRKPATEWLQITWFGIFSH